MLTQREGRRDRIKTNPRELVLVAIATIITSHLGEQEQKREWGERDRGRDGDRGGR